MIRSFSRIFQSNDNIHRFGIIRYGYNIFLILFAAGLRTNFGVDYLYPQPFAKIDSSNPVKPNRPGIFVSGAFQGPMDIPESVFTASAAGSQCGQLLDYRRGKLTTDKVYPPEKDVAAEEPRIGVFVCHCGTNIGRVVDVPGTVDYALTLPNVVHAQEQLFSCATNSAQEITDLAVEKGLNRVVIAACSPRTLEPLFQDEVVRPQPDGGSSTVGLELLRQPKCRSRAVRIAGGERSGTLVQSLTGDLRGPGIELREPAARLVVGQQQRPRGVVAVHLEAHRFA